MFSKPIKSILIAAAALAFVACDEKVVESKAEPTFALTSPTLKDNEIMPARHWFNQFGCTGDNVSPALN